MRLKEKYWSKALWGSFILFMLCVAMCSSCSVQSTSLFEPREIDFIIIEVEHNWVYVSPSHDTTIVKSWYWPNADTLKVGNCFIAER